MSVDIVMSVDIPRNNSIILPDAGLSQDVDIFFIDCVLEEPQSVTSLSMETSKYFFVSCKNTLSDVPPDKLLPLDEVEDILIETREYVLREKPKSESEDNESELEDSKSEQSELEQSELEQPETEQSELEQPELEQSESEQPEVSNSPRDSDSGKSFLDRNQKIHRDKIYQKLTEQQHVVLDISGTGTGKTRSALAMAKRCRTKTIVFCPVPVIYVWEMESEKIGITDLEIISFESMRSTGSYQPKHGLLRKVSKKTPSKRTPSKKTPSKKTPTRRDSNQSDTDGYDFVATNLLKKLVKTGVVIIFDEAHYLKNNTAQFRAAKTICNTITNASKSKGVILFMSATLSEKISHIVNFLNLSGYLNDSALVNSVGTISSKGKAVITPELYVNLAKNCLHFDEETTKEVTNRYSPIQCREGFMELIDRVVKPQHFVCMPKIELPPNVNLTFTNGYYNLDEKSAKKLKRAVRKMSKAAKSGKSGKVTRKNAMEALEMSEIAKLGIFRRLAMQYLVDDPSCKVAICLNFVEKTLKVLRDMLAEDLKKYEHDQWIKLHARESPDILCGEVKKQDKAKVIHNFQNDPNSRLLLMGSKIGGNGISLHDTTGNHPIIVFVSPYFSNTTMMQLFGRFARKGTASNVHLIVVYCEKCPSEGVVIKILKSNVETMRSFTAPGIIPFPDEFTEYHESEASPDDIICDVD